MVNMKILDLPLKAKWYEMIESEIRKRRGHREIKKYWIGKINQNVEVAIPMKRLGFLLKAIYLYCITRGNSFHPKENTLMFASRFGYTKRTML